MPFPFERQAVGLAKDTVNVFLTAGVAAGATSIPVSTNAVPAAYTIFFCDGPNSESRAVTAGGGTTTLTVAATTNAHAANCYVYAQPTASIGPTVWIPVTGKPSFSDAYAMIDSMSLVGSNVEVTASTQAAGNGVFAFAGDFIADVIGYLLGNLFGAVDFTGGSPNQHIFAGMNTSASAGQPTPFVFYYYDGNITRAFAGSRLSELTFVIDPKGNITWTTKGIGFGSIVVANPTISFSALAPQVAWTVTPTIAGVALPTLQSAKLSFKRKSVDAIQTCDGTQSPYKIMAGALQADGDMNFVYEDQTIVNHFYTNDQPVVTLAFVNGVGASQTAITFQISKTVFETGWLVQASGGVYMEASGPWRGVANATDANTAGGGISPARVILKNAVANNLYQ